jgi:hypothetical protein
MSYLSLLFGCTCYTYLLLVLEGINEAQDLSCSSLDESRDESIR